MAAKTYPWMADARAELNKLDARLRLVFEIRWQHLDGTESARSICDWMRGQGYAWTPTERSMRTWLAEILPVENKHRQAYDSRYQQPENRH
jgi:hypothetical protein